MSQARIEGGVHFVFIGADEHQESATSYYIVPKYRRGEEQFPNKGDFGIFMEDAFGARGCHCAHDCCGHRQYSQGDSFYDKFREQWIVVQSSYLNV